MCSSDTGAACIPRSCGREAASGGDRRGRVGRCRCRCVRAGRRIRGVSRGPPERERRLRRARSHTGRAAHRLGRARARRRRRLPRRKGSGRSSSSARARPRLRVTAILRSASLRSPPSARRSTRAVLTRLRRHRPGVLVNETIWSVLALRAAGEQPPPALVQAILAAQAKGGGFSWSRGGSPDSNDTAAAIQALRAAGVAGAPIATGARRAPRLPDPASAGFSL